MFLVLILLCQIQTGFSNLFGLFKINFRFLCTKKALISSEAHLSRSVAAFLPFNLMILNSNKKKLSYFFFMLLVEETIHYNSRSFKNS